MNCEDISILSKGFSNSNLRHVDFSRNNLGQEGMDDICEIIGSNKMLEKIKLQHNNFFSLSMSKLCDVLVKNLGIRYIDISKNNICQQGLQVFIDAFDNSKLKGLHVFNCRSNNIGDLKAEEIAKLVTKSRLRNLDL